MSLVYNIPRLRLLYNQIYRAPYRQYHLIYTGQSSYLWVLRDENGSLLPIASLDNPLIIWKHLDMRFSFHFLTRPNNVCNIP